MRNKILSSIILILTAVQILMQFSCERLIETPAPSTSVNQKNVYESDQTAISVLNGIYSSIQTFPSPITGISSVSILTGLSSDELSLYNGVSASKYQGYYKNELSQSTGIGSELWPIFYKHIFYCNAAIEGINQSNETLTPSIKYQLSGEAKLLRAFLYLNLANLYGDIPMPLTTDWQQNEKLKRSPLVDVYNQITKDLVEAEELLPSNFLALNGINNTSDRIRPTKWAAIALLARVYLYTENWSKSEEYSTLLINNRSKFYLENVQKTFKKNAAEAIWQLQPIQEGWNTEDARTLYLQSNGPTDINGSTGQPVFLSSSFIDSFNRNDLRRLNWVDSVIAGGKVYYFPVKYKSAVLNAPLTEYLTILRLAEQYLIRSEARIHLNKIDGPNGAIEDIDSIRVRAGLSKYMGDKNKSALLNEILKERQFELFTEHGHRWIDLKRLKVIDSVMSVIAPTKGGIWSHFKMLYPLPLSDIQKGRILDQNPGY